ncbi:MAG TPA: selenium-binding protein SBP56-related protein [Gemmatimonadales bacterium]|nr:selenium-binding protein SBP56-related protein [Gemmatimonadales bacterium]
MPRWRPDPTFYPSPRHAAASPAEELAYVTLLSPAGSPTPDAIGVVDVDPASASYGRLVGRADFTESGNELHHFGWNACSSHLCPWAPHPHAERRYLVVPGTHSSRIHIVDTKPDPRAPRLVKVIEGETVMRKTGYAALHSVHCGPDGVYVNALGAPDGDGPGGLFTLDHETFDVAGPWEEERGPQRLAYDFAWHLGHDVLLTSEWGTPNMVTKGVVPELLLGGKYGNAIHVWDLRRREHRQRLELGPEQQMVLELRPAHDPTRPYGFVGVVVSTADLSASVWMWHYEGQNGSGSWKIRKVIEIPAEPADPDLLPPIIKGFKAVPPLVTDINLSVDDRFLYVSCWGTGEIRQYDVTDPFNPRLTGSVRVGGIVRRTPHPANPEKPLNGAPQMVELSRDGRRVYVTNSLYTPWDEQWYPDGLDGWMIKLDASPKGGLEADPRFFLDLEPGVKAHQVRLQGGDASSDSFCYS